MTRKTGERKIELQRIRWEMNRAERLFCTNELSFLIFTAHLKIVFTMVRKRLFHLENTVANKAPQW